MPYKDPEKHRAYHAEYTVRYRDKLRRIINEAKAGGCERCPETEPACLDFHHVTGTKEFTIARGRSTNVSEPRLRAEIAKCIVLCANCHRKHHAAPAVVI